MLETTAKVTMLGLGLGMTTATMRIGVYLSLRQAPGTSQRSGDYTILLLASAMDAPLLTNIVLLCLFVKVFISRNQSESKGAKKDIESFALNSIALNWTAKPIPPATEIRCILSHTIVLVPIPNVDKCSPIFLGEPAKKVVGPVESRTAWSGSHRSHR